MHKENLRLDDTTKKKSPKIVILGAGITGLVASYKLSLEGYPSTVFQFKGCTFDYGPHAFHTPDQKILDFYLNFLGEDVLHLKKHVEIKFRNSFYDYPIKPINLLKNLSFGVITKCGLSYLWQPFRKMFPQKNQIGSLEELFISLYGNQLYQLFFEKYTEKVWGFHPRNLSDTFLKYRLPSYTLFEMAFNSLKELFIKNTEKDKLSTDSFVRMQYYPRYGAGTFPDKLAKETTDHNGIILLNSPVHKIHISEGKVSGISVMHNGSPREFPCDICITTIPITHFIRFLEPAAPEEISHSMEQLHFRALIIFCIVIQRDFVIHCDALYFHDRVFHRVGQMNSYSKDTVPSGKSAITIEVACFYGDPLWNMDEKELFQWVLKDMREEGLDISKEVEDYFVLRKEYGYPAPTLGYEEHLVNVFKYLNEIPNLYSGGRQGLFTYIQMFHGVQMGFAIAEQIISGAPKPIFELNESGKKLAGKDPYFV